MNVCTKRYVDNIGGSSVLVASDSMQYSSTVDWIKLWYVYIYVTYICLYIYIYICLLYSNKNGWTAATYYTGNTNMFLNRS